MSHPGRPLSESEITALMLEPDEEGFYKKTCEYCGREYTTRRNIQRYCSGHCKRNARYRISIDVEKEQANRPCEWCGQPIGPRRRSHAKYCSDKCRKEAFDSEPCVYCGMPADTRDHFIPQAFVYKIADFGVPINDLIVPACRECNSTAGDRIFKSLKEKRIYIKRRYLKKYRHILDAPGWTKAEINELGPGLLLQSYVKRSQELKKLTWQRLNWRGRCPKP